MEVALVNGLNFSRATRFQKLCLVSLVSFIKTIVLFSHILVYLTAKHTAAHTQMFS